MPRSVCHAAAGEAAAVAVLYNGDAAFQHGTAGKGIGGSLQQEATREQQSTAILSVSAIRVDAQCTGWGALRSREVRVQRYSRRRWARLFGRVGGGCACGNVWGEHGAGCKPPFRLSRSLRRHRPCYELPRRERCHLHLDAALPTGQVCPGGGGMERLRLTSVAP